MPGPNSPPTQPPPHAPEPGAFSRVLRLLSDLTAYVFRRTDTLFAPTAAIGIAARALIRMHALTLCLQSRTTPTTDPFGLPAILFAPHIPAPAPPASFTTYAATVRPRSSRPRAPRTVADVHRRATRRMEAKLAVYTVGEILITICRDLGILPNFDDWAAPTPAPHPSPPLAAKPPTPTRTTHDLPSFPLWAVPLHPSG